MRKNLNFPKMDQWVCNTHGRYVLDVERKVLDGLLPEYLGKRIVQIGGPTHDHYLKESPIPHKIYLSSDVVNGFDGDRIQADLYHLPLQPESIDVMVLVHVLEYVADPERVLKNCYDSLSAEGRILVLGFNPYSTWGMAKLMRKNHRVFRNAQFITPYYMRRCLRAVGFHVMEYKSMCFRLPIDNQKWFERLTILEPVGRLVWPSLGGIYLISAQKKVLPLDFVGPKVPRKILRVRTSTSATLT